MSPDFDKDDLPERLRGDMEALFGHGPRVPSEMDDKILAGARRQLLRRRIYRYTLLTVSTAAAAGLIVTALLTFNVVSWQGGQTVAHNGVYQRTGNILDAFYLARQLEAGKKVGEDWDANHDGIVNQGDVTVLATAAVKLKEGAI